MLANFNQGFITSIICKYLQLCSILLSDKFNLYRVSQRSHGKHSIYHVHFNERFCNKLRKYQLTLTKKKGFIKLIQARRYRLV